MTDKKQFDFKAIEGLHFNMSDEDYFAIPCLSASGLKMLKNNPSKFWWYSWMNPNKEDKDTDARIIGKAFHKRLLEGSVAFYESYAREFAVTDDNIIASTDDIKQALQAEKDKYPDIKTSFKGKDEGLELLREIDPSLCADEKITVAGIKEILQKEKSKYPDIKTTFKSKDEGIEALIAIDESYRGRIYDCLKQEYEKEHDGKIFLSDYIVDRAELSAKVIESHPTLKTAFIGGYSEVTCVWYDEEYGEWFKCRYDYLKVSAINDLKTFSRLTNKNIEKFLPESIAKFLYNIQATLYLDSMKHAKRFAGEGKVFGDADADWLKAFSDRPCEQFHLVFQQKEEIPNAYEVIYSVNHQMHEITRIIINDAIETYQKYKGVYGDAMWFDITQSLVLTDDDYPIWAY